MKCNPVTERIASLLTILKQGASSHEQLDQLMDEATCTTNSTEREYLYTVISSLYPDLQLPASSQAAPSKAVNKQATAPRGLPLVDSTNRPYQSQAQHGQQAVQQLELDAENSSRNIQQVQRKVHNGADSNNKPVADVQDLHTRAHTAATAADAPAGNGAFSATTNQIMALVTAATTAATKAVARTILHHTHHSKSHATSFGTSGAADGPVSPEAHQQQQQVVHSQPAISSRLQQQRLSGRLSAVVAPGQPGKPTDVLPPEQRLLLYAGEGVSKQQQQQAGAQQLQAPPEQQHAVVGSPAPLQPTAPAASDAHGAAGSMAGSALPAVTLFPRIWFRPAEQQQEAEQADSFHAPQVLPQHAVQHQQADTIRQEQQDMQQRQQHIVNLDSHHNAPAAAISAPAGQAEWLKQNSADLTGTQKTGLCPGSSSPAGLPGTAIWAENVQHAPRHSVRHHTPSVPAVDGSHGVTHCSSSKPEQTHQMQLQQQQAAKVQIQQEQSQQSQSQSQSKQQPLQQHDPQQFSQPQGVDNQQHAKPAPQPQIPSPMSLPPELHAAVNKTLQHIKEPAALPAHAAVAWQQTQPDEAARVAQHLLGGFFDYHQAAMQLNRISQAVERLGSSTSSSSIAPSAPSAAGAASASSSQVGSHETASKQQLDTVAPALTLLQQQLQGAAQLTASPVDDGDGDSEALWPAVLGDVVPPITRFYEQKDAWQDVTSFSRAVHREVAWRLAAKGPTRVSSSGTSKSVTWAHSPRRSAAAPVTATPTKAITATTAGTYPLLTPTKQAATAAVEARCAAAANKNEAQLPAAAAAKVVTAVPVRASSSRQPSSPVEGKKAADEVSAVYEVSLSPFRSKDAGMGSTATTKPARPIVAFGRRVDKPLSSAGSGSRQRRLVIASNRRTRAGAATAMLHVQPAQQLPVFTEPTTVTHVTRAYRHGATASRVRTASAAAALQRLIQRRQAVAGSAACDAAHRSSISTSTCGSAVGMSALPGLLENQGTSLPGGNAAAIQEVLDVLLGVLIEQQQRQRQQDQAATAQEYEIANGQDTHVQTDGGAAAQQQQHQQPGQAALQTVANMQHQTGLSSGQPGSKPRQFAAVYDIVQPPKFLPAATAVNSQAAATAAPILQQPLDSAQQWQQQQQYGQQFGAGSTNNISAAGEAEMAVPGTRALADLSAAELDKELIELLVDELMSQADAVAPGASSSRTGRNQVAAGDRAVDGSLGGSDGGDNVTSIVSEQRQVLRHLVAKELPSAIDRVMAREVNAAAAAAVQHTAELAAAAAGAAGAAASVHPAAHMGIGSGQYQNQVLLHALTEAVLAPRMVPIAQHTIQGGYASCADTPIPAAPAATSAVAPACTAAVQPPPDWADNPSVIVGGRVRRPRSRRRFGQLPGLGAVACTTVDSSKLSAAPNPDGSSDEPQQDICQQAAAATGVQPGPGKQTALLCDVAAKATVPGPNHSVASDGASASIGASNVHASHDHAGAVSQNYAAGTQQIQPETMASSTNQAHAADPADTAGQRQQQQQPQHQQQQLLLQQAYMLVPVPMLPNAAQQQQQQWQPGPLALHLQQELGQFGLAVPKPHEAATATVPLNLRQPAYGVSTLNAAANNANAAVASPWAPIRTDPVIVTGVPVPQVQRQSTQRQHQHQPRVVWEEQQPLLGHQITAGAMFKPHRYSLPSSDCFKDSIDISSSSSSFGSVLVAQHCEASAAASSINLIVADRNGTETVGPSSRTVELADTAGAPWSQQAAAELVEAAAEETALPSPAAGATDVDAAPGFAVPAFTPVASFVINSKGSSAYSEDFEAESAVLTAQSEAAGMLWQQHQQLQGKFSWPEIGEPHSPQGAQERTQLPLPESSSTLEVLADELQKFARTARHCSTGASAGIVTVQPAAAAASGSASDNSSSSARLPMATVAIADESSGQQQEDSGNSSSATGTRQQQTIESAQLPAANTAEVVTAGTVDAAVSQQHQHVRVSVVRLWRPPKEAVADDSAACPIAAPPHNSPTTLLRLQMGTAAVTTPEIDLAAAAAASSADSGQAGQPLLPSSDFSSVLGLYSSSASLTSITGSTSAALTDSSTTFASSMANTTTSSSSGSLGWSVAISSVAGVTGLQHEGVASCATDASTDLSSNQRRMKLQQLARQQQQRRQQQQGQQRHQHCNQQRKRHHASQVAPEAASQPATAAGVAGTSTASFQPVLGSSSVTSPVMQALTRQLVGNSVGTMLRPMTMLSTPTRSSVVSSSMLTQNASSPSMAWLSSLQAAGLQAVEDVPDMQGIAGQAARLNDSGVLQQVLECACGIDGSDSSGSETDSASLSSHASGSNSSSGRPTSPDSDRHSQQQS